MTEVSFDCEDNSVPTLNELLDAKDELFDGMKAFDAAKCIEVVDKFLELAKTDASDEVLGNAMEICESKSLI